MVVVIGNKETDVSSKHCYGFAPHSALTKPFMLAVVKGGMLWLVKQWSELNQTRRVLHT